MLSQELPVGVTMKMKAGMTQTASDGLSGFYGWNRRQMHEVKLAFPIIGERGVDTSQEGQEFLVAVTLVAPTQDASGGRIVSGKQRKSPVTHIIMSLTLGQTGTQWQNAVGCARALESGSSHRHKAQWLYRADSDKAPQYRAPLSTNIGAAL